VKMTHVFISYVRENSGVVDRLAAELSDRGATVWLDRNDIAPGSRWKDEIRKAIKNGDFFLACFSKEYNERQKTYMNEELVLAIDVLREMPTYRAWFIPVLINSGRIPERRISNAEDLSDLNAVDLSKDWNDGIERIVRSMRLHDPLVARAILLSGVAKNFNTPESIQAIEHIGKLGIADKRVVGILVDATTSRSDHRTKYAAVRALVKIGAGAVPVLATALQPAEEVSRKCILSALRRIGPGASAAVPEIVNILKEDRAPLEEDVWYGSVQERAIMVLAFIGSGAGGAVPCLSGLLKDSSERIRALAAFALTKIGPASLPALGQALVDPELQRGVAAGMLWAGIAGSSADVRAIIERVGVLEALPGLLATLEGERITGKTISNAAIYVLGEMGREAAAASPVLVALRKTCHDIERRECLDAALARIGRARRQKLSPSQGRGQSAVRRRRPPVRKS
jgi:HEAT repeat protein